MATNWLLYGMATGGLRQGLAAAGVGHDDQQVQSAGIGLAPRHDGAVLGWLMRLVMNACSAVDMGSASAVR
jgi:hypothetical protein